MEGVDSFMPRTEKRNLSVGRPGPVICATYVRACTHSWGRLSKVVTNSKEIPSGARRSRTRERERERDVVRGG